MTWSRNPQPRHLDSNPSGQNPDESKPDAEQRIDTLEWRVDFQRRAIERLSTQLREMTAAYHEVLDREEKAIEGIALAMLEKPVDMGLLEYVEDLGKYCAKLREERSHLRVLCNVKTDALNAEIRAHMATRHERDNHLGSLLEASIEGVTCSICRGSHGPEIQHAAE